MRQKEGTVGKRLDFMLKLRLKDNDVIFFSDLVNVQQSNLWINNLKKTILVRVPKASLHYSLGQSTYFTLPIPGLKSSIND